MAQISLGPDQDTAAIIAWAEDVTAVLTGDPPSQHVVGPNESWGDLGLRRMLEPEALQALVPRPWGADLRIEGHLLDVDITVAPEFVSLGSDQYIATYDSELEIIRSWCAFIDGELAWRQAIAELVSVQ